MSRITRRVESLILIASLVGCGSVGKEDRAGPQDDASAVQGGAPVESLPAAESTSSGRTESPATPLPQPSSPENDTPAALNRSASDAPPAPRTDASPSPPMSPAASQPNSSKPDRSGLDDLTKSLLAAFPDGTLEKQAEILQEHAAGTGQSRRGRLLLEAALLSVHGPIRASAVSRLKVVPAGMDRTALIQDLIELAGDEDYETASLASQILPDLGPTARMEIARTLLDSDRSRELRKNLAIYRRFGPPPSPEEAALLSRGMASSEATVRLFTATVMVPPLGRVDRTALRTLAETLGSDDPEGRGDALESLSDVDWRLLDPANITGVDVIDRLIALLKDEDSFRAANAARILGDLDLDEAPIGRVETLAKDPKFTVAAAITLASQESVSSELVTSLSAALRDKKSLWKGSIVRALARTGPEGRAQLIEFLLDGKLDRADRGPVIDNLFRRPGYEPRSPLTPDLAAVIPRLATNAGSALRFHAALAGLVNGIATDVCDAALQEGLVGADWAEQDLISTGPAVVKPLLAVFDKLSPTSQSRALAVFRELGPRAKEAVPLLKERLALKGEAGLAAAVALASIDSDATDLADRLIQVIESPDEDDVLDAPGRALIALRKLGPAAEKAVPHLIPMIENFRWREDAIRTLGRIGPSATPAVPKLIEAASDPCIAIWVIPALGAIGPSAPESVPFLLSLLDQPDVASESGRSLRKMGDAAKPAIQRVLANLESVDRRQAGFAGVKGLGPTAAAAVPQLIEFITHGDSSVKGSAIETLSSSGAAARPAVPLLLTLIGDEEVSQLAIDSLIFIARDDPECGKQIVSGLVKRLTNEDRAQRRLAINALGFLGEAGREALPTLNEFASDSSNDRGLRRAARIAAWTIEHPAAAPQE